ncbi:MAG: helix-turn-helix transcriptional regulator [Nitrospirae bacterium]|nr:helix-turn-helix transcriptional regulator [Nitrospirota bacterium]
MTKRKNIGETIKKYRHAANMSQMVLAEKIGISYQQLQKYEKGINNISVYRLQQISDALKIPISNFLESLESEKVSEEIGEYGLSKEEKKLLDLFRRIDNKDIRRGLLLELKGIVGLIKKK